MLLLRGINEISVKVCIMYIHHHLGLGDHVICNGLVRYLSRTSEIKLFCKIENLANISVMYSDNKNIEIINVYNDAEAEKIAAEKSSENINYIRLGVGLNGNWPNNMDWAEVFYYQVNIPYSYSWEYFKYNKPLTQNSVPSEPYVFLCSQGSDRVDRLNYEEVRSGLTKIYSNNGKFFDNIDLIENAEEIHCVNSSYIHLIERIKTNSKTKLVYHKNFMHKGHSDFLLKKPWVIV